MPRGGDRGGRKPRLPKYEKREPMHKIRVKLWIQAWLHERFGREKGRIIEDLLLEKYGKEMEEFRVKTHNNALHGTAPARGDFS